MNFRSIARFYLPLFIFLCISATTNAQSYIDFSKYNGGAASDSTVRLKVVNNESYVLGYTTSPDFPVTNGSTYGGKRDMVLTKYNATGNVVYSMYLGGKGDENFSDMKVLNSGEVFILGTSDSINYPVTNGSSFRGKTDVVVTKIAANGTIAFSQYLGGTETDFLPASPIQLSGNEWIIGGTTGSPNFTGTSNGSYKGGSTDIFLIKINATTGAIITSQFLGGNKSDNVSAVVAENNFIYVGGVSESNNVPITIGNPPVAAGRHCYAAKLNLSDLSIVYSRYIAGDREEFLTNAKVLNDELHMVGFTYSKNYPVTNGSTPIGGIYDDVDGFYTRLKSDGSFGLSTYVGTPGLDIIQSVILDNGNAYVTGIDVNTLTGRQGVLINKINANGSIAYNKSFPTGPGVNQYPSFKVVNNELYAAGVTSMPEFPITNNSQFYNGGSAYLTKFDPAGNITYSSFMGQMSSMQPIQFVNNKFYILGNSTLNSFPVTDSSKIKGGTDNILMILEPDGKNYFSSYIGGLNNENPTGMEIAGTDVYISGKTYSADYPVTQPASYKGAGDIFLTKLSFCPPTYDVTNDIILPNTQTVCKYGLAQKLIGKKITVAVSSLPTIYLAGVASDQKTMEGTYQWQIADAPGGPWTDIPGATLKDYTPVVGGIPQYFRRLTFALPICGSNLIHTSDVATVLVNNLTAPTVNAGGPFITCPGSPVTIGGSPIATGGNEPYASFVWDMGAAPVANPIVSPTTSTIYTVTVTDALGCQQLGQAIVFSYAASAGQDKSNCAGNPVTIGAAPIPGVSGIQYNWTPNTAINNINIAQPTVNPVTATQYELTMTVTKSGGGTCVTKDDVTVTPVAAPATTDFAGPDKVICLGGQASLGTAPEADFNYVWSPGIYLTSSNTSNTDYVPGNILMPEINPATISLTAQKDGCSFTDKVIVATIESRAGITGCGPRIVGLPDRTPDINENYQWIKISGPGNFTGATNLPQVPVSASVGGNTIYGLIVTYNGHACFSQVTVTEGCLGCQIIFDVNAKYKCPSYGINGNDVTITAISSIGEATYKWTPAVGLSNYNSSQVKLTDNVARTYTVTATSIYDPTITCSEQITVNNPAYAVPTFNAPDVVACAGVPVTIGAPPVGGYTYEWEGTSLSDNFISNPSATAFVQTYYPVKVTDANGCQLKDTVLVDVQNVNVDAGPDWLICSNGVATLGTPAQPNTTYLWSPSASPWQNGTNQFSAQPQVLAVADVTYTVIATTSAGCTTSDQVTINVNNSPTVVPAPDVILCAGKSIKIGSPALPGVTYQWTPTTGLNDPTLAQPLASPSVNTTYHLLATFPGNCALPAVDDVIVTVSNPAFTMPNINFCPGSGPVSLGNAAPTGMAVYIWQPSDLVSSPFIRNPTTLNPPPSVPTTYSLYVLNNDGCETTSQITIQPALLKPDAGADKTICKNVVTSIGSSSNATGPTIAYSWSPATNLSNASVPNPTFTGTTGGVFTFVLTKTDNSISCSSKDTVVITVVGDLLPVLNTPTLCQNTCAQIGTNPLPGVQYSWSPQTGLSNPSIANPVACVTNSTISYVLTAADGNGCSASANVVLGVSPIASAQINIPTVNACVGDNNARFQPTISPAGNYNYLWSPNDGTLDDITSLNPLITVGEAGIKQYTLRITDNVSGCVNTKTAILSATNCTQVATIGDRVWFDMNANGLQDAGEAGASGISVKLFNSTGFNIASTTTDANGLYVFGNVPAGNNYYIMFSKPDGYVFTTQNVGGISAENNSKADLSGRSTDFNATSGITINNLDAGIKPTGATPVTLLSFTGVLRNRQTLLNWQTTAELNNHYFDVERSSDRFSFSAIGRLNGHGTTNLPQSYSLIDPTPLNGMNYYRLRQVDFDGKFVYSNVVSVRLDNTSGVAIYYNNKNNTAQIIFGNKQPATSMSLYAANGQLIKTMNAENITSYTFPLPILAKGIYLLKVKNANLTFTEKLFIAQ